MVASANRLRSASSTCSLTEVARNYEVSCSGSGVTASIIEFRRQGGDACD